jgi:hypothetical protein
MTGLHQYMENQEYSQIKYFSYHKHKENYKL